MLRHVVMVRLAEDMTDDQKEALRAGLGRLPEVIPEIRAYRLRRAFERELAKV